MKTTYYLYGPKKDLKAIAHRLTHWIGSRAIAVLDDDEEGLPRALIVRSDPGNEPDASWLQGPLYQLQAEHEAGQPWSAKAQSRALAEWRKGRDTVRGLEAELVSAKARLIKLSRDVVRAHGNRAIIDVDVKLTPSYVPCNDTVYLVESEVAGARDEGPGASKKKDQGPGASKKEDRK